MWFTILSVASAVGQAYSTYQQGAAMKAYYDAQADMSALRYKAKEVEAREQGAEVLKQTNRAVSSIVAKGAAGGILPNVGSVLLQQYISLREGAEDYNLSKFNEEIINNMGIIDFQNLKSTGETYAQSGITNALIGLGTDLATAGQVDGFGSLKEGMGDAYRKMFPPNYGDQTRTARIV